MQAAICEIEEIGDIYPPRSYEKECVINEWYHSVMYPRIIPRSILEVMRDLREEVYPSIQFSLLIDSTGHIFSAKIFLNRIILQKLTDEQLCELYDNIMAQPPIPFMKFYRIDKLPYTPEEKKRFEAYLQKKLDLIQLPNKDEDFLRQRILTMYANPAINHLKAIAQ